MNHKKNNGNKGRGDIESQTIPRLIISLRNKYIRFFFKKYINIYYKLVWFHVDMIIH